MLKEDVSNQVPTGTTPDRPTTLDPAVAKALTDRSARFSDSANYVAKIKGFLKESATQDISVMRILELNQQLEEVLKQAEEHVRVVKDDKEIHPSILPALQEFQSFFGDYNLYFWGKSVDEFLSAQVTYESVLATALENTRQVWSVLSLAINQRYNPVYKTKLEDVDSQSREIIKRASSIVALEPIIYFDRVFEITRYPYQAYPLLGIPLDRFSIDGPSALAHELGHHVFWNNGDMAQFDLRMAQLSESLANLILGGKLPIIDLRHPDIFESQVKTSYDQYRVWIGWLEEVFADSFGTLIAGPQFAKTSQDILVRQGVGELGDLIRHDDEHPTAILRPFVATATLRIMAGDHPQAEVGDSLRVLAEDLERRWLPIWEEGVQAVSTNSEADKARLIALKGQVEPVVRAILTAELFIPEQGDARDATSLLKSVKYWAKEGTEGVEQIQELQSQYSRDVLFFMRVPLLPTELAKMAADRAVQESPFDKLLKYVRLKRQEEEKRSGRPLSSQEWRDILNLQLVLSHSHTGKQTHSHPIYHSHSASGIEC